jgi:hypothetical protein
VNWAAEDSGTPLLRGKALRVKNAHGIKCSSRKKVVAAMRKTIIRAESTTAQSGNNESAVY